MRRLIERHDQQFLDEEEDTNEKMPASLSLYFVGYREVYLLDVTWVDESTLSVIWSRRSYNKTVLSLCKEEDGWTCKKVREEEETTGIKGSRV